MAPFFLCLTAVGLRRELAKRDDFGSDRDMEQPDNSLEIAAHEKGYLRIAGVDEVGRGRLPDPSRRRPWSWIWRSCLKG